jgi:hypothetical protein
MASVRYEFGISVRSDSIRDLLDQIKPVGSQSRPVLNSSRSGTDYQSSLIELNPEPVKILWASDRTELNPIEVPIRYAQDMEIVIQQAKVDSLESRSQK